MAGLPLRRLVALVATGFVAALALAPTPAGAAPTVRRVGGADRFETAALLAADVASPAPLVYLASGEAFPDALAAAPAGAPILLVARNDVPGPTAEAIVRLNPKRVVVLGGEQAVEPAVMARAREIVPAATVERIGGEDRFETAALLAAGSNSSTVFVASGEGFQDPLVASATAAAEGARLLLVAGASVPAATSQALAKLPSPRQIVLVASAGSLAANVNEELGRHGTVTTVGGATPFETSALLAARYPSSTTAGYLASGLTYPDALAGSAAAGAKKAPLLLVRGSCLVMSVRQQADRLSSVTLLGGELALTKSVHTLATCPTAAPPQWPTGELTDTWVDPTRRTFRPGVIDEPQRTLPVFVAFPAMDPGTNEPAMGSGPFPVITVGHGLGTDPATLRPLARGLASQGYVAVVPTFPLTNNRSPGGPYTGDLANQTRDLSFLVTTVLEASNRGTAPLGGMADPARIGATGISFGGITSLMLLNTCCIDSRFKAVLSYVAHFPSQVPTAWAYGLGMPLLMFNTTNDPLIPYGEARQGWDQAASPKFMATFVSDQHSLPPAFDANVRQATTAFLDRYVKGDVTALDRLLHSFDGVDPAAARLDSAP